MYVLNLAYLDSEEPVPVAVARSDSDEKLRNLLLDCTVSDKPAGEKRHVLSGKLEGFYLPRGENFGIVYMGTKASRVAALIADAAQTIVTKVEDTWGAIIDNTFEV